MKRLSVLLLSAVLTCAAFAAESVITAGTPIATVEEALTKNGFPYGNQYQLQWLPPKGHEFLFCKLDERSVLIVEFDTRTKKVHHLIVWYAAPVMQTRADGISIAPVAIALTPQEYALIFKKEANQPVQPTPARRFETEVSRITTKQECVCTLQFEHSTGATYAITNLRFRVESPATFAGREITLRLREAPAVADAFQEVFTHRRFVLMLSESDLRGEPPSEEYNFSGILVRALTDVEEKG
ncbi:MAG: hypothetical protein QM760_04245 [Nibricoccus sp.]